ncbi:MAG: hypothetical protein ACJ78L_09405 [Chloroflexota bacterium]|jgi:hypothetical protein
MAQVWKVAPDTGILPAVLIRRLYRPHHHRKEDSLVSMDEQHVALPSLYGAPAYARPPGAAPPVVRPFDPDELPLEADQTDEERTFTSTLPARAFAPGGARLDLGSDGATVSARGGRRRQASIREVAGRFLRR